MSKHKHNVESTATDLLAIAESRSRKLKPRERQQILAHLDEKGDIRSTAQLAALFNVSEMTVLNDQRVMLSVVSQMLSADQAMSFVAHHLRQYRLLQNIAAQGMALNARGSEAERKYIETQLKVLAEEKSLLKDIGLIRPELAAQNTTEEHWVATVDPESGACGVHAALSEDIATSGEPADADNEQAK